ncbi:MAG: hypothetical protein ACI93R_002618 [Flavobacteriales bacterium]|jgi:hypothetical protein
MDRKFWLILFLGVLYPPYMNAVPNVAGPINVCNMWVGTMSDARWRFEASVIENALELSRKKYAPCSLRIHRNSISAFASNQLMLSGERLQLQSTAFYPPDRAAYKKLHWMTNPYMSGVLGYRRLLTTKDKLPLFENIETLEDLKALSVGQVANWADTKIYRDNGFKVVGSANFDTIWKMLTAGRFDYFPLGISEIDGVRQQYLAQIPDLVVVPDIVLYYDFPIYVLVSPSHKELAERLRFGFEQMHESGLGDTLLRAQSIRHSFDPDDGNIRFFVIDGSDVPSLLNTPD